MLKLGTQSVNVYRLHIASDGVLHLDTVARVLKGDPLDTIVVLSHNQGGGCWNRARSRIWVDPTVPTRTVLVHGRPVWLMLGRAQRSRGALDLGNLRLHLWSGAARHALLLAWVLLHLVLGLGV